MTNDTLHPENPEQPEFGAPIVPDLAEVRRVRKMLEGLRTALPTTGTEHPGLGDEMTEAFENAFRAIEASVRDDLTPAGFEVHLKCLECFAIAPADENRHSFGCSRYAGKV